MQDADREFARGFVSRDRLEFIEANVVKEESESARRPNETDVEYQGRRLEAIQHRQDFELLKAKSAAAATKDLADRAVCISDSRKRNFNRSSLILGERPVGSALPGRTPI